MYGYQDFPGNANEKNELDQILEKASQKGFKFISDRDARAPGGLHPEAHLWDNGTNAIDELSNIMKVREKALSQFGEKNIRPGMPMAFLEDVLVPIYLLHRYQVEAVTKLIGGLNYTYALRGDGQVVTQPLNRTEQQRALQAVINTLDPSVLIMPERIIKLIPPRPAGYNYTRELFKKRTGLAFDALSPAESAADLSLSFLFNSERMNRLVQYQVQYGGLGLDEMIQTLFNSTWKADRRRGMEGLIQLQTEQIFLTYLLAASVDDNNSFITKSVIQKSLNDLKTFIENKKKTTVNALYTSHFALALERFKSPEKAKPTIHATVPPGAPIGCYED
jgi:hypothetical protein